MTLKKMKRMIKMKIKTSISLAFGIITSLAILNSHKALAQDKDGKVITEPEAKEAVKRTKPILDNLDSLLVLWYVKGNASAKTKRAQNVRGYKEGEIPQFTDSVYAERLRMIESPLPFTYNSTVKAYIDLYAYRKRAQVEKMLGISEYYFPIMEEIFDRYKMPVEIKYLSIVESALNTRAVSVVGATGLWQFMYSTGKMYDLKVNSYVDLRKDPVKSTEAAAKYLRDLHNLFGDWFLAIAAYNCGPGNVNKAIRRSGGKRTFWEIYRYLPIETRGYVPAFIAATYVFTYHQEHNLYPVEISLPTLTDTVMVNRDINFKVLSNGLDISMDLLKDLNPQYKMGIIPGRGKSYTLVLPIKSASLFVSLSDSLYAKYAGQLPEDIGANFDRNSITPIRRTKPTATATLTNTADKKRITYLVKSGDNIGILADVYDVSVSDIRRWNKLRKNQLLRGQRLIVYIPANQTEYYNKINKMTQLQKKRLSQIEPDFIGKNETGNVDNANPGDKTLVAAPIKKTGTTVQKKSPNESTTQKKELQKVQNTQKKEEVNDDDKNEPQYTSYVVKRGDTFWNLSQKFGIKVEDLKNDNGLKVAQDLKIGLKIKIRKP